MDFTLATLGCTLPTGIPLLSPQRRKMARTESNRALGAATPETDSLGLHHRDSLCLYSKENKNCSLLSSASSDDKQDDDTASTLSVTSSSDEGSLHSDDEGEYDECFFSSLFLSFGKKQQPQRKQVRFAAPLVTAVHTRPTTTREDKYYLHYTEHDYIDFKIEFLTGRERTRQVSFARDVVSEVRTCTTTCNKTDLFYTESELQGFLDDFVRSLNQKFT